MTDCDHPGQTAAAPRNAPKAGRRAPLPAARRFRAMFFLTQVPLGIQLPFFVLFLKYTLHMSDSDVGFFTALSGLAILLFQQPWGYAADVLFPKRTLLTVNLVVSGALFYLLGMIRSHPTLLLVYFLFQIFSTPIIQLLLGLLFAHHGSGRWFGTLRAYASLGFIVANIAVAVVADKITKGNLHFIFPFYLFTNLLCAAVLWWLPESPVKMREQTGFWKVQRFFLSQPAVRWFLLTIGIYQLGHSLSYSLQSVLMVELGADMRLVSTSYSLAALFELPVFFLSHRLIARFGEERLIAFAAAVQAVRWLLVWHTNSAWFIVMISCLHCVTFGLFYAAAVSYINSHAPRELKSSAQTLFALVYSGLASLLSNLLGSLIVRGGYLEEPLHRLVSLLLPAALATPLRTLYLFSSLCAALSFLCALRLSRHYRSRRKA
jgi:PPP family 3-phenylpropionic acid transporter